MPYTFTLPVSCVRLLCLFPILAAHTDLNGLSPRQIKSDSDDDDLPNVTLDSVNETGSTALSIARAVQEWVSLCACFHFLSSWCWNCISVVLCPSQSKSPIEDKALLKYCASKHVIDKMSIYFNEIRTLEFFKKAYYHIARNLQQESSILFALSKLSHVQTFKGNSPTQDTAEPLQAQGREGKDVVWQQKKLNKRNCLLNVTF